jgi:hypothetical protein
MDNRLQLAMQFSDKNLRTHPNTDKIMALCSDDVTFTTSFRGDGDFTCGKFVAYYAYKWLCEDGVVDFKQPPKVTFDIKEDHVVWWFESVQLRQGILPSWLASPKWYTIENRSRLYFKETVSGLKISRYVNEVNKWTPL